MAYTTNPKLFVLQAITFAVLFTILGSLTFTAWNQGREIQTLREEVQTSKLNTEEDSISSIIGSLNRNRRDASQSSIDILANALTDIIEKKLYSIIDCNRNENNGTDCTLKPGPKGEKGNNGEQGKEGPRGIHGDPGVTGIKGQLGYPGYKGEIGPQGSDGRRGPKGDTGAGLKGDMGSIGPQGTPGEMGQPGVKGDKGELGAQGINGSVGPLGPVGRNGAMGAKGQPGNTGNKGEKGMTGLQGPPGPKGNTTSTTSESIKIGILSNPATSCGALYASNYQSDNYWITGANNQPVNVYCDMERSCCSNGARGWMKVADVDMTDSNQQCPNGFKLNSRTTAPLRTCGRPDSGCVSTTFPVNGVQYSRVCGRIVAYQYGTPSAFNAIRTINGIILTHGESLIREHIWSFVNGGGETYRVSERCPCSGGSRTAPSFIGQDYFCDSGVRGSIASEGVWYADDPLWDGQGCGSIGTCCEFNNPPWFCKQLPPRTADEIELRLCENSGPQDDDSPFEIVEIYVH